MKSSNDEGIIHENVSPDFVRTIAHLDNLMVVVCDFKNGPMKNPDPPHSHIHEQITYVAEGEVIFFKGDKKMKLVKGDIISLPSGVPHCIQTLTAHVRLIDSFNPLRKDFLKQ